MRTARQIQRCLVATIALSTCVFDVAEGNHYILPCGDLCPAPPEWTATGNLNVARTGHTATLLANGKVLVAGGGGRPTGEYPLAFAELYDPASGTWTLTGSMNTPRNGHTATLLPSGKVLVAGGITATPSPTPSYFGLTNWEVTNTAEVYDPDTGVWTPTGGLITATYSSTATLLQNGTVLVAGGLGGFDDDTVSTAEVYDPVTGIWNLTGSLMTARYGHTATLLQDGTVLVVGGSNDGDFASVLQSSERYDPLIGAWVNADPVGAPTISQTTTRLRSGQVLLAGGYEPRLSSGPAPVALTAAALYDRVAGVWRSTGLLNTAREAHTATLLPNGNVLAVGGEAWQGVYGTNQRQPLNSVELYDSNSGVWAPARSLIMARRSHTATLLADGRVLVAGGYNEYAGVMEDDSDAVLASTELYAAPQPSTTPGANYRVGIGDDCVSPPGSIPAAGCFAPDVLTINAGDSVTFFVYQDVFYTGPHNVVADDGSFRCARGCDGEGGDGTAADYTSQWTFTRTFNAPTIIHYHDEAGHATGVIVVQGGAAFAIDPGTTGARYDPAPSGSGLTSRPSRITSLTPLGSRSIPAAPSTYGSLMSARTAVTPP